jgi:CRISPR type III-B/RAMP module RAMP protein Cmr6
VSLDFTYGVPMIPGSSLKGAMLRVAMERFGLSSLFRDSSEPFELVKGRAQAELPDTDAVEISRLIDILGALFGDVDGAGIVTLFGTWLVPNDRKFFIRDVVTPHQVPFYNLKEGWPDDRANPIPVGFLTLPPGIEMCVILRVLDKTWSDYVWSLVDEVLVNFGIGAKTSADYGRFVSTAPAAPKISEESLEEFLAVFEGRKVARLLGPGQQRSSLLEDAPDFLKRGDRIRVVKKGSALRYKRKES